MTIGQSIHPTTRDPAGRRMRAQVVAAAALLAAAGVCGCTDQQLRRRTVSTASTLTDLQYDIVLDNLAMLAGNPDLLPWDVKIGNGAVQVDNSLSAQTGMLRLVWQDVYQSIAGRAEIMPKTQTTEQWNVVPVTDPKELRRLQAAYRRVLGLPVTPNVLGQIEIPTGWIATGTQDEVPPGALFVGRWRDRAAWVTPDHVADLTNFTIAILSITKLKPSERPILGGIVTTPG